MPATGSTRETANEPPSPALRLLRRVSFGATAAIVTSMGVVVGLLTASTQRGTVAGSLLIIALADNLTDSLGVHVYQEAERLEEKEAFRTTLANFVTRLLVSLTFLAAVLLLPPVAALWVCVFWGTLLLSVLSYFLARARGVSALSEISKHCGVAAVVIALSALIGGGIASVLH